MELGRRGFFFSLISMLLLIGLFYLAQPRPYESTLSIERTSQERILFTNAMIQNFEQGYLSRAVESQAFVVLEALAEYRLDQGDLYTARADLESDFIEGLINGTFNGGAELVSNHLPPGLSGSQRSLAELLDRYANASGQNHNIRFEFSDDPDEYAVRLTQNELTGPWQILVELNLAYNVTPGLPARNDVTTEIARWELNRTVTTYVNIRGVRDPYLYVRSDGAINASIDEFYTERWNRAVFIDFVESGRYFPTNASMSMLGRYYDSMEFATCCGMMTTINETRYDAYNSTIGDRYANITYTDCGYFPESPVTLACRGETDRLVYAVVGLSANSNPPTNPSTFPFTIGGGTAAEVFNLSVLSDLTDTFAVLI